MRYCLDSNIIIDIFRQDESLRKKVDSVQEDVCITPIVLAELFKGAHLAQRQQEALDLVEDFVCNVDMLEFDYDACRAFGEKHAELVKKGKQAQEADLMIACIALVNNAVLVTRNIDDFKNISGLQVVRW